MKVILKLFFIVIFYKTLFSLRPDELVVLPQWDKGIYYQGDDGKVTLTILSKCPEDLKITWIGIHFEWLAEEYYFSKEFENNPLFLPAYGSTEIFIPFSIPPDAKVGENKYYIRIHCIQYMGYGPTPQTWYSSKSKIYIHDAYEKEYYELLEKISLKIKEIENYQSSYKSPEARRLIVKAKNEYELGLSAAKKEKWEYALSCLKNAYNFLTEAEEVENSFRESKETSFFISLIGIIFIIGILSIFIIKLKKTKKKDNI